MDPIFEIKIKQSFSKVKKDINSLRAELSEYKALLKDLINKLSQQMKEKNQVKRDNFVVSEENSSDDKKISIGNKGVYAFSHSVIHSPFTHLSTHSNTQLQKNQDLTLTSLQNNQLSKQLRPIQPLQTLTNKEFLVFLTIYQLEKEIPRITYEILASKLSLTSGCIRSYITSLIRKKAPIIKSKINNKIVILSIEPSFRSLTSEQKLINLYYQNDLSQSTLI